VATKKTAAEPPEFVRFTESMRGLFAVDTGEVARHPSAEVLAWVEHEPITLEQFREAEKRGLRNASVEAP
jgi:hypothetical protein